MSIIGIIVTLAVIGLFLWIVNVIVPMPATFKIALNVIVGLYALIWIFQGLGYIGHDPVIR
jgi:uncharacterized protein YhhL (DUF1145 family)